MGGFQIVGQCRDFCSLNEASHHRMSADDYTKTSIKPSFQPTHVASEIGRFIITAVHIRAQVPEAVFLVMCNPSMNEL